MTTKVETTQGISLSRSRQSLPQDVSSTSDRRLIELKNQVQRLMEAHIAPMQPIQVNKITSLCAICSGPHDTQYCMENPEQAYVEYASSRIDEAGGKWYTFKPKQNCSGDTYNPSWKSHPNLRWRQPQKSQNNFSNTPNRFQSNDSIPNRSFNNNPQNFNNQSNLKGLVSNFMASQDARLSKFEADFKQQQSEMTNKINTVLKVITDRLAGALPSDMVKNPKLNVKSTFLVLSERSYPTVDPQYSSHPFTSINAVKTFLEVLAHAPIYNAMLDKYVESLKLGKNRSAFVQGEVPAKMEDPGLFILPCRLGDSKPFDTLADLGSCVNIIPLYLFKKLNIKLLEETYHIFGLADKIKSYPVEIVKDVEVHIGKLKLLNDFYIIDMKKDPKTPLLVGRGFLATANVVIDCRKARIAIGEGITREWENARDAEINPFKDVLVFRRMVEFLGALPINLKSNMWESEDLIDNPINWDKPPKNGDGAWHAKIRLIDPDGEEFTKTLQSIPTSRKLPEKESPWEIINLDHFYDT
ncbi:MAK10-like protein [Tanacetum coccineum]